MAIYCVRPRPRDHDSEPGEDIGSDSESDKAVAHAATRTERLSKPPEPSVSMAETGQRYEQWI